MAADIAAMIAEFHIALGQQYGDGGDATLRMTLHREEHDELMDAFIADDRVGIAQELADVVYVAYGTAFSLGVDLDAVIAEVHRANLSKFDVDGTPILRADGKLLKGPDFRPADVAGVLAAAVRAQRVIDQYEAAVDRLSAAIAGDGCRCTFEMTCKPHTLFDELPSPSVLGGAS